MSTSVNTPEYSVSELSHALKRTIEAAFGHVRVRGEISGFKRHASGHLYFSLKDAEAGLDAVMWKGVATRLGFRPEDGLEVIAIGRLSSYPKSSRYQIVVERMEVAGVGALLAQIEDRRRRLAAEGLFEAARKKPIPFLPAHIGVITSPAGAVIRDILHRLADRFPRRVTLWPVPVQGEQAAGRIAAGIAGFNALPMAQRPDLLIVARGGGSVEDLMAFNAEEVVRAVAASHIPLISAVGHETDTTLIDHVSDQRAPTPTAAAELAVPVRADLQVMVAELSLRAMRGERRARMTRSERLEALGMRLPRPAMLLGLPRQRLDDAGERLEHALRNGTAAERARLSQISARLPRPSLLLQSRHQKLVELEARLRRLMQTGATVHRTRLVTAAERLRPLLLLQRLQGERGRLDSPRVTVNPMLFAVRLREGWAALHASIRLIESLSPEAVLKRGFVLVSDAGTGKLVKRADCVAPDIPLNLRFADGTVVAHVGEGAAAGPPTSAPSRPRKSPHQGNLF